jgi:hypothetical protein
MCKTCARNAIKLTAYPVSGYGTRLPIARIAPRLIDGVAKPSQKGEIGEEDRQLLQFAQSHHSA